MGNKVEMLVSVSSTLMWEAVFYEVKASRFGSSSSGYVL
jgi:hypothetical protein